MTNTWKRCETADTENDVDFADDFNNTDVADDHYICKPISIIGLYAPKLYFPVTDTWFLGVIFQSV